jgi:hypothetical protein
MDTLDLGGRTSIKKGKVIEDFAASGNIFQR